MRIEELFVGAKVECHTRPLLVESINAKSIDLRSEDGSFRVKNLTIAHITPIKVNKAWLKKNKFVDNEKGQYYLRIDEKSGLTIRCGKMCGRWLLVIDKKSDVNENIWHTMYLLYNRTKLYVHDIQRALIGCDIKGVDLKM